ncbi:ovate family protein [Striga asiatica]|uniref:Transcription repressor n=1 Tax=Striga asiatica TaxID=4170 RepID=A0A5A7R6D7_STRAF|nr:ovate family protein [Striga asiatica]
MCPCKIPKWKSILTAKTGCVCGPKSTDIIQPTQRPKTPKIPDQKPIHRPFSSGASTKGDWKPATDSDEPDHRAASGGGSLLPERSSSKTVAAAGCHKIHDSLAVVKDSDDPYLDFRRSMLQMIFAHEIYSTADLQQLLDCFLRLNSPRHHETIVRAFVEICSGGGSATGEVAEPVFPVGCSCEGQGVDS